MIYFNATANLDHQYVDVTAEMAIYFGYKHPEDVVGLSLFDVKTPVVETSEVAHTMNQRVIRTRSSTLTFDISQYEKDGLQCCFTKKTPKLALNNELTGVFTEACLVEKNYLLPFAKEIYQNAINLYKQRKFRSVIYEIVDDYAHHGLTAQESKILFLIAYGKMVPTMAKFLCNSDRTIETHVANIKDKLGVDNKEQLIEYAFHTDIIRSIPRGLILKRNYWDLF